MIILCVLLISYYAVGYFVNKSKYPDSWFNTEVSIAINQGLSPTEAAQTISGYVALVNWFWPIGLIKKVFKK